MRSVILHYHLFKNAGTSLDRVLQRNFGPAWCTREFPAGRANNTPLVLSWLAEMPDAVAFSSHTAMGPLPAPPDTRLFSIMFFRNPIDRIRSAYRFERQQTSDGFGAVLARSTSFSGYVRTRLALGSDRQCRNFQTFRLASLLPGPEPELDRARQALSLISFAGLVDQFDASGRALEAALRPTWPDFAFFDIHANRTDRPQESEPGEDEIHDLLQRSNSDDFALLATIGDAPLVNPS